MEGYIDLKSLTLDELTGIVNLYPWFGNARRELCIRMSRMGDEGTVAASLSEAALYVSSRKALSEIGRAGNRQDCSDKDIGILLKSYISQDNAAAETGKTDPLPEKRQVYVVGGDYFSQSQYDDVKESSDSIFGRFAAEEKSEETQPGQSVQDSIGFYTETLAQIYAEQGYPDQAKKIYSQLILAYPEKNAYFASLIQKIEEN